MRVHHVFVLLLAGLVDTALPAPGLWPVVFGLGMGLTLMLAFGLPPVLQLAQVPALRVIRRDVGNLRPASLGVLALGVAGFAVLLLAASSDVKLGLITVGGFAGAVALFALASWGAVLLLRRVVRENTAPRWLVLATRQLSARARLMPWCRSAAWRVGLLALVLLVLLRTDLISSWRQATPADAPNRFVINVQPEQGGGVPADAARGRRQRLRLVPDDPRPAGGDQRSRRARPRITRTSGPSAWWTASSTSPTARSQPAHNEIVAGRWTAEEQGAISMEDGIAKTLGLKLGDRLRFDIAGMQMEIAPSPPCARWTGARCAPTSLPCTRSASMPDVPSTYLSAFRAPATAWL